MQPLCYNRLLTIHIKTCRLYRISHTVRSGTANTYQKRKTASGFTKNKLPEKAKEAVGGDNLF